MKSLLKKRPERILFAGVNSSFSHSMCSYGTLRAYTEKFVPGPEWVFREATLKEDPGIFALELASVKADILTATAYLFNVDFLMSAIRRFRQLCPDIPVVLGGPEFLGDNEGFLRCNTEVDFVVRGDESGFHLFLKGLPPENIQGFCFINANGVYIDSGKAAETDISPEKIPSPFLMGYYDPAKPFIQIETSRGCSGGCTFCTSSVFDKIILFPVERVRKELLKLYASGFREVRIRDRTFNESTGRACRLLEMFLNEFRDMRFHLEINPAGLNEKIMRVLRKFSPGSLHIEAGIQTFTRKSVALIKRPATPDTSRRGLLQLLKAGNSKVHADLIAGLPEQRYEDILNDVSELIRLNVDEIQLENLKILPGTPMSLSPHPGYIWNPAPPYEILKTADLSAGKLVKTRFLSKMIDGYYNTRPLKKLFRVTALKNEAFLEEFTDWYFSHGSLDRKALSARLKLLHSFATEKNDSLLEELIRFTWLAEGLSPAAFGIKAIKNGLQECLDSGVDIEAGVSPARKFKRYFRAKFDFKVAEILKGQTKIPPGCSIYTFFISAPGTPLYVKEADVSR